MTIARIQLGALEQHIIRLLGLVAQPHHSAHAQTRINEVFAARRNLGELVPMAGTSQQVAKQVVRIVFLRPPLNQRSIDALCFVLVSLLLEVAAQTVIPLHNLCFIARLQHFISR